MRSTIHTFLLAGLTILAISGGFAAAAEYNDGGRFNVGVGRSLRVAETNIADAVDAEDRTLNIINTRIQRWVLLKKSDEQVMEKLGIAKGLSRAAMKDHPNFQTFEDFQVKKWLKSYTSTSTVWDDLGLNNVVGAVKSADGYGTYEKYVFALGDKVDKYIREHGRMPKLHKSVNEVENAHKVELLKTKYDDVRVGWIVNPVPL
ncbi:hypothetical protein PR001_g6478 [Phytophthora rubi]|uniref:RxLR effector protein n=1 Tax=Phytophthora rubi TaxID=129364 RepID=A0A6A3NBN5_9STRA|nr:hypothetical protein PR002_g6950 [Phytophthora rubi]KAE9041744.1 hypothetical protein PR001_g6478 [Phytophthora rubi]